MNYYAITVKKTTEYCMDYVEDMKDYEDWLKYAYTCGLTMEKYCWEIDPKGVLHLHGIIKAKSNFYKNRTLRKGFHQHIEKLEKSEDIVKWMIYMHKDYSNQPLNHCIGDQADPEYRRLRAEALYNHSREII